MAKELNFLDIVVLDKIHDITIMESFSGMIGTSFFETAEVMGKMKMKGLIDIVPTVGKSEIKRTIAGEQILKQAEVKSQELLDELDHAVMKAVASGVNEFDRMQLHMNIVSDDLAVRLWKLTRQGYLDYSIKNVRTFFSLAESGFKITGFIPKIAQPTVQTQLPAVPIAVQAARKEARKEIPEKEMETLMRSSEDVTKNIPRVEEKVDISKKHAELKLMRGLKAAISFIIIAVLAYLAARYLGYIS